MTKESKLMESKEMREEFIGRMEVLDKVGDLIFLPSTEFATIDQVATYYNVSERWIKELVSNNLEEITSDGFRVYSKGDIVDFLKGSLVHLKNFQGKSIGLLNNSDEIVIPNRGLKLFPKRAILRVGMLLRDSEVAKEIRSRLLDIVHDVEQGKTDILEGIKKEIDEEKEIKEKMFKGMCDGDVMLVAEAATLLSALKNRRIAELEAEKEAIITSKLDITESRSVINRIIRKIAIQKYNANFATAYNEFYSKVNYKLHVNVKNRKGEGLDRFKESEIFEMEKIARNWAVRIGLDLEELLNLG